MIEGEWTSTMFSQPIKSSGVAYFLSLLFPSEPGTPYDSLPPLELFDSSSGEVALSNLLARLF
jgi:hypothetical protein